MTSRRSDSTVLFIAVLVIAAVTGCGLATAAPSAGSADTISIPLPESDVAVHVVSSGFAGFTGTGVQYISRTGEPSIPCQWVRVLLPPDTDTSTVKAAITDHRWTAIDGEWDIQPAQPLVAEDCEDASVVSLDDDAIVVVRDADIYESDALFPSEPVVKVDVQVYRGWKMAQIFYAPFAYNPVSRTVFRLSGSTIEVTFDSTSFKTSSVSADFTAADEVLEMTSNFAEMAGEYGGFAESADTGRYVVITTSAIQTASTRLMDFVASKEARGFTVQVVTEGTWGGGTGNAAAENIRSWLKANYPTLNIKYVLLIGNPNPSTGDVPMKMCYPQSSHPEYPDCPTDFYYAELTSNYWDRDGDGHYGEYYDDFLDFLGTPPRVAEVAVGRIPYYGSITDLDHILSKIINYENAPANAVSWRQNALLPMNPSDPSTPGYQLGEEIRSSILIPEGWAYHRVYEEQYSLSPPPETYPCTVTNVTNTWNGSDFGAVFWWTHGDNVTAFDVMDLTHAATLDDAHAAFAFQGSCLNGEPEASSNLGYSLLKNGCVSTICASRVSWYDKGQSSFDDTPTNSGMTFEYAQRLVTSSMYAGDALNGLKADISPYDQVLWMNYLGFNLYGDPAVGLFNSAPDEDAPSVVTYYAGSVDYTSARLRANLTSLGTADNVTVSFEWGTTSGGSYNEVGMAAKDSIGAFYFDLGGLDPAETYYYKAKAVGNGMTYGLEKSFTTPSTPPSVATGAVVSSGATWAVLNGDMGDLGTAENVTVSFEWGFTTSYGNETALVSRDVTGGFSDNLTGLTAKTTYYFRAKAVGHGTTYGEGSTFTTPGIPASVITNDASNLTTTSAQLNGNLTDMGTAGSVAVSFEWGTASGVYGDETTAEIKSTIGTFYFNLTGRTPGATYYYRAKAVGDGTSYGDEESFTPLTIPPLVTTGYATNIVGDGARLNGTLSSMGTASSVSVSFEWGTTSGNYTSETQPPELKDTTGDFYFDLSSLASGTPFYYRAKAVGHGDPVYGLEKSFTTGTPPEVSTLDASDLTFTSATLSGDLTSLGGADNVAVSFVWGPTPVCSNESAAEVKAAPGTFYFALDSLDPGTTYYYKAKANGEAGPVYGDQVTFSTLSTPPTVTTNNASNLTIYSATLNGNLDNLGSADNVSVSFEWGTQSGVYVSETTPVLLSDKGSFSSNLHGLAPGTTFYYRAKALGHDQPQFGSEITFATLAPPVVSTGDASDVAMTSVRLNGNLSSLGSAASVSVCFQWGTASGVGSETTGEVKANAGAFYFDLNGLAPGTTYYYRAKAEGEGGAIYGDQRIFTTSFISPEVTTNDATNVTADSARLNADLVSLGTKSSVTVSFLWKVSGGTYAETTKQTKNATGVVFAELNGLAQDTTYYYKVKVQGDGVPVYGEEKTFATIDGFAPVISMASASRITASRATITWTTDEPATSQVEYGLTEEYGSLTILDADLVESHDIRLTGLKPGKTYHYRVVSKDAANNQVVSADATFTTPSRSGGIPLWLWTVLAVCIVAGIIILALVLPRARLKNRTDPSA